MASRPRPLLRRLAPLLGAVLASLALAAPARGDEIFVLDSGTVLRGVPIREADGRIVVRLSGFGDDARVTLETSRIVRRFSTREPGPKGLRPPPVAAEDAPGEGQPAAVWTPPALVLDPVPPEEPELDEEGFFERLGRVLGMSVPPDANGRVALLVLVIMALMALVGLGARLVEVEGLTLGRTALLALLLAAILGANLLFEAETLRADRAVWALPLQAALWLVSARLLTRCEFSRAVLLLAFVLFGVLVGLFAAGAVLVSF
jgi:hypothetical protein